MKSKVALIRWVGTFGFLVACLTCLLESSAEAATTKYYVRHVSTCTVLPEEDGTMNGHIDQGGVPTLTYGENRYDIDLFCDLKLPDNATIKQISFYGVDNSAAAYWVLYLYRIPYSTGTQSSYLASVISSDSTAYRGWSSTTITHAINNNTYSYRLDLGAHCASGVPPSHSSFYGVNIVVKYEVP